MDYITALKQYPELATSITSLEAYNWENPDLLKEAIEYVWQAHQGQYRKSGEPFAIHPITVAAILAEQKLHTDSILAGMFHDVVEDTHISSDDIAKTWGKSIAQMVDGVTKIVQVAKRGDAKREKIETYRKLLLAATVDARVLVIKLADRLHNMRTISSLSPDRQQAISKETLEIYAPIAHRLGMHQFKTELQDRAFKILDPMNWELAFLIQEDVKRNIGSLEKYEEQARQALNNSNITARIKTRVKNCWSISQKINRKGGNESLYDVLGMRIIVQGKEEECYIALGIVHDLWPPRFDRFHDYIAVPKSNLYQSLHTTVNLPEGEVLEIQIRTEEQDEIAEYGIAAHWHYKEQMSQGGPKNTKKWITDIAAGQNSTSLDEAFENMKADTFAEEIYVCSPRGDIYILPAKSTPIDFAYAVHSELGDMIVGSKVSNKLKPINTELKNGDVIEVITQENAHPSKDWLEYVKTSKAKQRIRQYHTNIEDKLSLEQGWKTLITRARKNKLGSWTQRHKLEEAMLIAGYDNIEETVINVGYKPELAREVIRRIVFKLADQETKPKTKNKNLLPSVKVQGMNVDVRFAHCCSPGPGDSIIGYISLGRGISVHRRGCSQTLGFNPDRLVEVEWDSQAIGGTIKIRITMKDQVGSLQDLIQGVYNQGGEIIDITMRRSGVIAKGELICWTPHKREHLIEALEKVSGVLKIERYEEKNKN